MERTIGNLGEEIQLHADPYANLSQRVIVLRSKGLKDATCVGWFGDDWDCSVGSPPEAIDHMSSTVPVGYAV